MNHSQMALPLHQSGRARHTDPATSHAAARSVYATPLEEQVLKALRQCPLGATSFQLADKMGMSLVTVSPRLKPLVEKGLVIDSGVKRRGDSGRNQIVWIALEVDIP